MGTRNFAGGSKARPVLKADNLIAICQPISVKCGILDASQLHRPTGLVTKVALFLSVYVNEEIESP
jgi:hypothetical protein